MYGANLQAVILWCAAAFAVYCTLLLLFRGAVYIARRPARSSRANPRPSPQKALTGAVSPPRIRQFAFDDAPLDLGQAEPPAATRQLGYVSRAKFARKRVMNRGTYRVFRVVEEEVAANWPEHRVFSQTALGEVIESQDRDAHGAIDGKKADVLVIDQAGFPVVVVGLHGHGHYEREDRAARDAVKEALRRAGVAYLEVLVHHSDDDIVDMLHGFMTRGRREVA